MLAPRSPVSGRNRTRNRLGTRKSTCAKPQARRARNTSAVLAAFIGVEITDYQDASVTMREQQQTGCLVHGFRAYRSAAADRARGRAPSPRAAHAAYRRPSTGCRSAPSSPRSASLSRRRSGLPAKRVDGAVGSLIAVILLNSPVAIESGDANIHPAAANFHRACHKRTLLRGTVRRKAARRDELCGGWSLAGNQYRTRPRLAHRQSTRLRHAPRSRSSPRPTARMLRRPALRRQTAACRR